MSRKHTRRFCTFHLTNGVSSACETVEPRVVLSGSNQLAAVLTGATAGFGQAEYRDNKGERSFELRVYNAAPGSYDVTVAGQVVAQITVNANRVGKLELRDGSGGGNRIPIPQNWPAVTAGTSVQIGNIYAGTLAVEGEDSRIAENATVRLVGANGEYLESEYEAEQEDGNVTVRRFELHVRNLAPSQQFALQIDGQTIGSISSDALGNANLQYSDRARPGFTAFPAGFPAITDGTQIALGAVLSGAYASTPATQAPITDGGEHLHLNLFGTGTMKGQAVYEAVPGVGGVVRRQFKVELWNGTPGATVAVNVGGQQVGSILINSKGYGKLAFEDGSAEKPFPANWPGASVDTIVTVGNALTGAFTGVGQTLSPLQENAREAYELDQTLGLQALSSMYENWGGRGEKWLKGKGTSWYFITPDGSFYRWDGKAGANGQRIAVLDDSIHARPELLHEAEAPEVEGADDRLVRAEAAELDRELNLTSAAASTTNWGGLAEKWFKGNASKWYFMTPDGTLTRWDGSNKAKGTVVGHLDERFHERPELLTEAETHLTETEKAFAVDRGLELTTVRNDLTNWGGENEKWVKSASQWYIVKQDGGLFRWDGRRGASGTRITTVARKYYDDTSLLVNAASAGTREVEAALDDVFVDLPDYL
ncbi:MAG: hypothetical protein U0996_15285 [Planctomycetaceae bacterium]